MNNKQLSALIDWCDDVVTGEIDEDILMDKITIKLDEVTKTVTIEIWDINEQYFNEFK